ncbi:MAG TPA: hypothetical protein VGB26_06705 [Nitrospiria bacterium]|jgi:hypothetical protein
MFIKWFVALLIFTFTISSVACSKKLDSSSLPVNTQFLMADNLMCEIVAGSNRNEIGNNITLMGLLSDQPKVKYESGTTSPMEKVFESESTLTIQLIASGTGSVDTFVIDMKKGHFSRAAAGSLAGVYSDAAIGTCK